MSLRDEFMFALKGLASSFLVGKAGPRIKSDTGAIQARNNADSAFANIQAADPAADDDLVTKRYVDANSRYQGAPVQDLTALVAIASSDLRDKEVRYVEDQGAEYFYDADASDAVDSPNIVQPNDTIGRWFLDNRNYQQTAEKNQANGYAGLNGSAQLDSDLLRSAHAIADEANVNLGTDVARYRVIRSDEPTFECEVTYKGGTIELYADTGTPGDSLTAVTDTDGFLCFLDSSGLAIKNRLGAPYTFLIWKLD